MTISDLVSLQTEPRLAKAFGTINPNKSEIIQVRNANAAKDISGSPLQAGITAHNLLLRWRDSKPLELDDEQKIFWPFLTELRRQIRRTHSDLAVEMPVRWRGCIGRCDIASADGCVVEMKVVRNAEPTPRHLAQLGAYAAGLDASVAVLAIVLPGQKKLVLHWYRNVGLLKKGAASLPKHGAN